jgi:hypothetical protein
MKPESPVFLRSIPGLCPPEVVYAKDQPQYLPLPVVKEANGVVTARWHMSLRERLVALFHGDVYVQINTFNKPLQPSRVFVVPPEIRNHVVSYDDDDNVKKDG